MIKSLAVYGDSFGTYSFGNAELCHKGLSHHWSSLLGKKYKCEVINYSLSGSSVYYSYKKFIETNRYHDYIIFLVTEPNRYIIPLDFTFNRMCVTNQDQIDVWRKTNQDLKKSDIELLDKLDSWFKLSDNEYNYDMSELMIEKVIKHRKDALVLPCYNISMRNEFRKSLSISPETNLCSLYYKQMDEMKLNDYGMNTIWSENQEYISGHLTPEYNKIAYENINFFIENKFWNWKIPKNSIINNDDKVKYFTKI